MIDVLLNQNAIFTQSNGQLTKYGIDVLLRIIRSANNSDEAIGAMTDGVVSAQLQGTTLVFTRGDGSTFSTSLQALEDGVTAFTLNNDTLTLQTAGASFSVDLSQYVDTCPLPFYLEDGSIDFIPVTQNGVLFYLEDGSTDLLELVCQ